MTNGKPSEVKRDSDFSVTVVFPSCRLASEFEREMQLRALSVCAECDALYKVECDLRAARVALHNMEAAAKRYKLKLEELRRAIKEASDVSH